LAPATIYKLHSKILGPTFFAKLKNFFAKLIFSHQNFFFGILEKRNLSEQKKNWRVKNQLSKKVF
jgi:hypothetical protein